MTQERAPITTLDAALPSESEDLARYSFCSQMVRGYTVLDVACGMGYGAALLVRRGGARYSVGVDISISTVAQAKSVFGGPSIFFVVAEAGNLPFARDTFDVTVSIETIEHLTKPEPLLLEICRTLRWSGTAVISTPRNETESRFAPANPFHHREYSSEEFASLLGEFFGKHRIWSQRTEFADDLTPPGQFGRLFERIRSSLRLFLPLALRKKLRALLGSRGRHPISSCVVPGCDERASAQIAVCTRPHENEATCY